MRKLLGLLLLSVAQLAGGAESRPSLYLQVQPSDAVLVAGQREIAGNEGNYELPREAFPDNKSANCPLVLRSPGYADLEVGNISWQALESGQFQASTDSYVLAPRSLSAHFQRRPWLWVLCLASGILAAELILRHRRHQEAGRQASQSLAQMVAGEEVKDPLIHSTLGRYRLLSPLGQGGMASVYRAVPLDSMSESETVALKVIRPDRNCPDFRTRFQREIRVSMKLDHPNVLRVIDWGEERDMLYLVMELVRGKNFEDCLNEGKLTLAQALDYMAGLLEALAYAHSKGIVHRDLKPSNIMITQNGKVKLMDFGLARNQEVKTLTVHGSALGTPAYLAPELLLNGPSRDALTDRSDQYALGVMLYQVLSGRLPFEHRDSNVLIMQHLTAPPPPISSLAPELPKALDAVLLKMLAKAPADRYESVKEAGLALFSVTAQMADIHTQALSNLKAMPQPRALPQELTATEATEVISRPN